MTDASPNSSRPRAVSPSLQAHRGSTSTDGQPRAECTSVDEVCDWLSLDRPTLDEVASCLRSLIVAKRELDDVVELLRRHAFAELGEPVLQPGVAEEPF